MIILPNLTIKYLSHILNKQGISWIILKHPQTGTNVAYTSTWNMFAHEDVFVRHCILFLVYRNCCCLWLCVICGGNLSFLPCTLTWFHFVNVKIHCTYMSLCNPHYMDFSRMFSCIEYKSFFFLFYVAYLRVIFSNGP